MTERPFLLAAVPWDCGSVLICSACDLGSLGPEGEGGTNVLPPTLCLLQVR